MFFTVPRTILITVVGSEPGATLEEDREIRTLDGAIKGESREAVEEVVPALKCKQSFERSEGSGHAPRAVDKNARFIPPLFSFGTCHLALRNAIGTLSELSQRVVALRTHGEMSDPELRLTLERTHSTIVN
jgi:hypothetical protein